MSYAVYDARGELVGTRDRNAGKSSGSAFHASKACSRGRRSYETRSLCISFTTSKHLNLLNLALHGYLLLHILPSTLAAIALIWGVISSHIIVVIS